MDITPLLVEGDLYLNEGVGEEWGVKKITYSIGYYTHTVLS